MSENRHVAFDTDLCRANPEAAAAEIARLEDHAEKLQAKVARLREALTVLLKEAEAFGVSGVYFDENCFSHKGPAMARSALEGLK